MNLDQRIEKLEKKAAAVAAERDAALYGGRSEDELLFFITHGYFPEGASIGETPETREFTYNGTRTTIILERVK
jgi:hypothetical protein